MKRENNVTAYLLKRQITQRVTFRNLVHYHRECAQLTFFLVRENEVPWRLCGAMKETVARVLVSVYIVSAEMNTQVFISAFQNLRCREVRNKVHSAVAFRATSNSASLAVYRSRTCSEKQM